jgi:DNA-binding SARP family transcriptional activator
MDFRVLGSLEVSDRGAPVAVGGVRERTALAVLLLRANRTVPVADLIDALWPQRPPATARQQIQTAVSLIRRALDDPARIVTQPPGYLIRVGPDELDAEVFDRRLATVREHVRQGDALGAADGLREALGLWRGPALDGLDAPPLRVGAVWLEERRMAAIEDRAEADLAVGRHGDVVADLAILVARYPYRERLHAALMRGLYRLGRQAEALHAYRHYRRELVSELGLEPGHQLQALERAILRADPALSAPVAVA